MPPILTHPGHTCMFWGRAGQAEESRHGDVGCLQGGGGSQGGAAGGQDVVHQQHQPPLLTLGNGEEPKGILQVAAATTGAQMMLTWAGLLFEPLNLGPAGALAQALAERLRQWIAPAFPAGNGHEHRWGPLPAQARQQVLRSTVEHTGQWILAAGEELTAPTLLIQAHGPEPHRFTAVEQGYRPGPPLQAISTGTVAIRGGGAATGTRGQGDQILTQPQKLCQRPTGTCRRGVAGHDKRKDGHGKCCLSVPTAPPQPSGSEDGAQTRRRRQSSPGNGPEHGHQGAMGILAVLQGVVKGNPQGLSIHLQIHPPGGDSHQSRCGDLGAVAVVASVGGDSAPVVVVHVAADAVTDGSCEGIGSHGAGDGGSSHPAPVQPCHRVQSKLSSLNPLKLT